MSTNPRKRSEGVKVSLTPTLFADLVAVSEAIGQTPTTAASFAIGQWVAQQKMTLSAGERMVNAVVERTVPELMRQLHVNEGMNQ